MEIKNIVESAKDSKHQDAILLLQESKPKIQEKFAKIFVEANKNNDQDEKTFEAVKKYASLVAEYIFNECVQTLVDDKKSDE